MARLSRREWEDVALVVTGLLNKQVGFELIRKIAVHFRTLDFVSQQPHMRPSLTTALRQASVTERQSRSRLSGSPS